MGALLVFLGGPIGRWLLIIGVSFAAVAGAYFKVKDIGWRERDAIAQEEARESERLAQALAKRQREVTEKVVTRYVAKVSIVKEKGEEVIREVEKLVPIDTCPLPGGFRVLHDSAATGRIPAAAERIDAASVPAQDAARTVAENYLTCRLDQERLTALQEWVRSQHALNSTKGD